MTKYEQIRLTAKDLGIKNWHNKKLEKLELEVAAAAAIQHSDSVDKILDKLEEAMHNPIYAALDILSSGYYDSLLDTFDDLVWKTRPSLGGTVQLYWLTQKISMLSRRKYSPAAIRHFLDAVVTLYAHMGWAINDDLLVLGRDKPLLNIRWHVDLWLLGSKDKRMVTKLLTTSQGA